MIVEGATPGSVITERLLLRPPAEDDRARFLELFTDSDFMVFAGSVTPAAAEQRYDHMVEVCRRVPFGKQPVIERGSGAIIGYTGVDHIEIDGRDRLEWGYRLVPEARGLGYATEAARALLALASRSYTGELLAIIAPDNLPSARVASKLGFARWKRDLVDGDVRDLLTLTLPLDANDT